MNIGIVITAFLFSIVLVSCKNNPYPADAIFEPVGKKVEKSQSPVLFLQVPAVMRFKEGEEGVYKVGGITPSGKSLFEVPNLPEGASFDDTTNVLKWTPSFSDADNFGSQKTEYREYTVKFKLYDRDDTRRFVQKESIWVVFDTPQGLVIKTDENSELVEGNRHAQDVTFEYADGSKAGVIAFYSHDLPEGTKISKSWGGSGYAVEFSPPVDLVRSYNPQDSKGRYADISFDINAIDTKGARSKKTIKWRVYDKEMGIEVFAPKKIQGGEEVFFTIALVDRNGEKGPSLHTDPATTYFYSSTNDYYISKMIFSRRNSGDQWSYYGVSWKNIPAHIVGRNHELKFKACGRAHVCKKFTVRVDFSGRAKLVKSLEHKGTIQGFTEEKLELEEEKIGGK